MYSKDLFRTWFLSAHAYDAQAGAFKWRVCYYSHYWNNFEMFCHPEDSEKRWRSNLTFKKYSTIECWTFSVLDMWSYWFLITDRTLIRGLHFARSHSGFVLTEQSHKCAHWAACPPPQWAGSRIFCSRRHASFPMGRSAPFSLSRCVGFSDENQDYEFRLKVGTMYKHNFR